jgi:carbon-monoxide dehydrogenase medium subunit
MLAHVARNIAYRAVRNRGTVGGSLAHADPAADWMTAMTALDARVEATGGTGGGAPSNRLLPMDGFMLGGYRTVLSPNEIISAVLVPRWNGAECWGYYKICRKVGEFADAIGAVVVDPDRAFARIVAGATGGAPIVLDDLGAELARRAAPLPEALLREALAASLPQIGDVKHQLLTTALSRAIRKVIPE